METLDNLVTPEEVIELGDGYRGYILAIRKSLVETAHAIRFDDDQFEMKFYTTQYKFDIEYEEEDKYRKDRKRVLKLMKGSNV